MSRPSSTPPRRSGRRRGWLLLVIVLLMINLPVAHGAWNRARVAGEGAEVTAEVVREEVRGSGDRAAYLVGFRLPEEVDGEPVPDGLRGRTVQVDRETHERAARTGEIEVRVLPDRPAVVHVEGQVRRNGGLVIALLANVLVLAVALLLRRFRGSLRARLTLLATGDGVVCEQGALLERAEDGQYVVRGEVVEADDDLLVLDLGDRTVLVDLDGHDGGAALAQTVEVRGHLVD